MTVVSKPSNNAYRRNFDRIFSKEKELYGVPEHLNKHLDALKQFNKMVRRKLKDDSNKRND